MRRLAYFHALIDAVNNAELIYEPKDNIVIKASIEDLIVA